MLTAKSDDVDKIIGLEVGADDYINKPFNIKELIARVRSILRRLQETKKGLVKEEFSYEDLKMNYASCLVNVDGKAIKLSPTELKIVLLLSKNTGRVYSRRQMIDNIWSDETFITDRAIDVHIRRIRSQIEKDIENPRYILTVRGFGYKFADKK
jgi:two-component system alkaline phosphatase synthesis response regulator PhoP